MIKWKDLDSIFARGLAVIIIRVDPEFFNLMLRTTPGVFVAISSISGSPRTSRALSLVRRETVLPYRVSTCDWIGANIPTQIPSPNLPRSSGYIFARRGRITINVATVLAIVSDLPD